MKPLSLQKSLISIAISSLLLSASQSYAEVIFNNPDEDFVNYDTDISVHGGESILIAQNIDLGDNLLGVSINEYTLDTGFTGSLTVTSSGDFTAGGFSTTLNTLANQGISYSIDINAQGTTDLGFIDLVSNNQFNTEKQTMELNTQQLIVGSQTSRGIRLSAGPEGENPLFNTNLSALITADLVKVTAGEDSNGGRHQAIYVDGTGRPFSEEVAKLTIQSKNVELTGSGSYGSTRANDSAVWVSQGGILELKGTTEPSLLKITGIDTSTVASLYANRGLIDISYGNNADITLNGSLISMGDYDTMELGSAIINLKTNEGSITNIVGDVMAIQGGKISIKTNGNTKISAPNYIISQYNSLLDIDIGSERSTNQEVLGITGAVMASASGIVNLKLSGESNIFNGVTLVGDKNTDQINVTLNNLATWNVQDLGPDNNFVSLLELNNGTLNLRFGEDGTSYKTLDVNTLSGNEGLFLVNAVLTEENEINNRVEIQNAKAGTHRIHVNSASGKEPTKPEQDGYLVRVINDEGATFIADNNKLEYGVYFRDYSIKNRLNENNETEWYLTFDPQPDEPELTPSGEAVLALAGMGAQNAMYLNQLSDVRQRLGEIRNGVEDGVWASVAAQKDRISGFSSTSFEQDAYRFNLGFDRKIGQWLVGANIKTITANQETKNSQFKADGNAHSEGINLYATWYNEIGCYADLVLSLDRYHQQIENRMLDGTKVKGGYHNLGLGVSFEGGRKFSLGSDKTWFIEPQAQLSYYWLKGDDFSMSNAMEVEQDNFDSLTGRIGVAAGKDFIDSLGNNKGQFHARLGVNHEFLGDQTIRVNNIRFGDDLLGTRIYYGFAGEWEPYENIKLFGYVERENGSDYTKEFEVSAGIKYTF